MINPVVRTYSARQIAVLSALAILVMCADLSLRGLLYSVLIVVVITGLIWPQFTIDAYAKFYYWTTQKPGRKRLVPLVILLPPLTGYLLLGVLSTPVQAQFLNGAETWMNNSFPGIGADLTALIFNVLRAIFVIYIAISLVQVIVAARRDDDWTTLARNPLIVLVTVVIGDLLVTFVTG